MSDYDSKLDSLEHIKICAITANLEVLRKYNYLLKDYGRYKYYSDLQLQFALREYPERLSFLSSSKKYQKFYKEIEEAVSRRTLYTTRVNELIYNNNWIEYYYGFADTNLRRLVDLETFKTTVEELQSKGEITKISSQNSNTDRPYIEPLSFSILKEALSNKLPSINLHNQTAITIANKWQRHLKTTDTPLEKTTPTGMFVASTCFGRGDLQINESVNFLKENKVKHIFFVDQLESLNTALGVNASRLTKRREHILKAELDSNIKCYQGVFLDLSIDGTPQGELDTLGLLDFVVIKILTRPTYNIPERVKVACTSLSQIDKLKGRIIIELPADEVILDCIDALYQVIESENLFISAQIRSGLFFEAILGVDQKKSHLAIIDPYTDGTSEGRVPSILPEPLSVLKSNLNTLILSSHIFSSNNVINFQKKPFSLISTNNQIGLKEQGRSIQLSNLNNNNSFKASTEKFTKLKQLLESYSEE